MSSFRGILGVCRVLGACGSRVQRVKAAACRGQRVVAPVAKALHLDLGGDSITTKFPCTVGHSRAVHSYMGDRKCKKMFV